MSPFFRVVSLLLAAALVAGCTAAGPAVLSGMDVLRSNQLRVTEPQASPTDLDALADGQRAFAIDLFHALPQGENLFFSPYSISLALAMTFAGARSETEQQIAGVLHFSLPQDRLHPAFNWVDLQLASRKDLQEKQKGRGADGEGFRLHVVNDLWGQQNHPFQASFLDLLSANYGAGLRLVDFIQNPEGARKTINDYVAKQTEQRIQDLIPTGSIDSLTRLVLTNAIYFNAAWQYPFEAELTETGAFTKLDGSRVDVPMMNLGAYETLAYQAGDGYQAVALPYENDHLVMWILVPDGGSYAGFEASLDSARLENILSQTDQRTVHVIMPRFQLEGEFSLGDILKQLGMPAAFDPARADFTGISAEGDLSIGDIVHKSFVKVDEAGTEAAAATAVIMMATGMPVDAVSLTIDRPFIFLIYDQPTQSILFMGRVLEPAAVENTMGTQ